MKDFGFTNSFSFTASTQLPGDGSIALNGTAGPLNQQDASATPVNAQITFKHVELGSAGVLPRDTAIGGLADLQVQVQSNGQTLKATASGQVADIKLAKEGMPSEKPVRVEFTVTQNEPDMTGRIEHATITVGRAKIDIAGTFQASGPTTAMDLKVSSNRGSD